MPRAVWPLVTGRPALEIVLTNVPAGKKAARIVLADTGAGNASVPFDILLHENDCLTFGVSSSTSVVLGGSYTGAYPIYLVHVEIPILGFSRRLRAVGIRSVPSGLEGIACFQFLNHFTYGNFGDPNQFGLEQ
jgi:hypothetical protein